MSFYSIAFIANHLIALDDFKRCSLRKIINNHDCLKVYRFSFYFKKVALQIIALLELGFYEAKFYCDSYFLSRIKLYNWGLSIKRIDIYYTLSTQQTLLHWNQPSAIMYTYIFDFYVKWFLKMLKKSICFTTKISIYTGHRHFEVLWSFILCIF